MKAVNVHNEWDPIEEIIVGTAINARLPGPDISVHAVDFPELEKLGEIPFGPFPAHVIEETEEDLNAFIEVLQNLDIKVRRPKVVDHSKTFKTPDWETDSLYNYCPRDIILAIGDMIIKAPSPLRSRFLETTAYKSIFIDYLLSGSRWISAPKPKLLDDCYEKPDSSGICLKNQEPIFDAANILRIGRDILYLISNSGNQLGAQWLQTMLGKDKYRIHTCYNVYNHKHIDTTFAFLRPGLVIVNPERINNDNMPDLIKSWDKIWCPEMIDVGYVGKMSLSTAWIGMNLLMVNPNLAIVEKRQINLIKIIEKHGIDVIPLQLRHPRTLGGGFHCATVDIRRKGTLEKY
uniref:Glycine amidinotransferase n=1 Tax=Candidatus Kentrum sp. TUN TaxID=2126343 RepID=A0A451AVZ5_9GAMM|nr:MAG: glycine amidinotransferase [Candidatus Kentron sp. TUN]VFK64673.1 MAG: glycine amidinotransferase [Candidatus Kentron sp. TUN]VFK70213.1 MAG: glycine amidinotransferase [Candidatus Kentron sp. TUN]